MVTPIKTFQLTPPKAPNLPIGPVQYTQQYQDQVLNALRLYFNQIDNFGYALTNSDNGGGGALLSFPNGAFYQDGQTTLSVGISNVSTTPIQVASTEGFPSSGWILIENEVISYTTKTATTFDGTITRGVLGTTNVAHIAGKAVTEVQGVASSTTVGQMLFNNTSTSNNVYIDPTDQTKVVFATKGLYNVQFSVQLLNYTTTEDNVTIWYRQNGVDVPFSAGVQEVAPKHGSSPGANISSWNIFVGAQAGDYIQMCWTSDTGNTIVATYPSGTSPIHPTSPGVILTATFVSAR